MKRKAESTTNGNPEGMQMRTLAATWRQVLLPMVAGESLKTARKRLAQIVSWLERNGEEDAAASLREGLEETLTIWKLALPSV